MTALPGDSPDTLTAHWAVLGKHAGMAMGYTVLGTSLDAERAERYLWGAQTGSPDVRRLEDSGGLPWRVFLTGVEGEPEAVCAMVEQDWDGHSRDATGAPIITSRLLLLDWQQAARHGVGWSGLAACAAGLHWPGPDEGSEPLRLAVPRARATELAAVIEEVGFEWAASVAALLTDRHQVVITPGSRELPSPEQRVRVLDAIAALLPYGCRLWLSGANWSGGAQDSLVLLFAATAPSDRIDVRFGVPAVPSTGTGAAAYLDQLRQLRAKGWTTADLIAHLLGATAPVRWNDGPGMLRILREVDFLNAVVSDVLAGHGRIEDVARVLGMPGAAGLEPAKRRALHFFLVDRIGPGEHDQQAIALLRRHWPAELVGWLADDVRAEPDPNESFRLCHRSLGLVQEVRGGGAPEFAELLATVVGPNPGALGEERERWVGQLIWTVQDRYGTDAEAGDRVLVEHERIGRRWLDRALSEGGPGTEVLRRLLATVPGGRLRHTTAWLRFAAYLCGVPETYLDMRSSADLASDALAFGPEFVLRRWRPVMLLAAEHRRPLVLTHLWAGFWALVERPEGRELADLLDEVGGRLDEAAGGSAAFAADLDLLRVGAARGAGAVSLAALERGLERERGTSSWGRSPGTAWSTEYAGQLAGRLAAARSEVYWQQVVALVLGTAPASDRFAVADQLTAGQTSGRAALVRALDERLQATEDPGWLDLDLSPAVREELERLPGPRAVALLREVRRLARAEPAAPEQLAAALVRALAARAPGALAPEALPALARWDAEQVDRLLKALWGPAEQLARQLYDAIGSGQGNVTLGHRLRSLHGPEMARLAYADRALSPAAPQFPLSANPGPGGSSAHQGSGAYRQPDPYRSSGAHDPHGSYGSGDPHGSHGPHGPHGPHGSYGSGDPYGRYGSGDPGGVYAQGDHPGPDGQSERPGDGGDGGHGGPRDPSRAEVREKKGWFGRWRP